MTDPVQAPAIVVQAQPVPAATLTTVQVVNFNLTDEELEEHIASCGRLMRVAFSEGRREDAYGWMDRMNEAIKSRSPEQVKKMERERFGCYFAAGGQEVRQS